MSRILITGASRGIGRGIAEKLSTAGTRLLLHGRDESALTAVKREVEQRGASAEVVICDLADADATSRMADAIAAEPLDVLVNNAGVAVVKPFEEVSFAEWQRTLAVNVTAPFLLAQRLAREMNSGASIVNILSVAAKTGFPGWSSYAMSKFALEGLSQSLRGELRARGIRVINIYPAATNTEIWNSVAGDWPREKMMDTKQVADAVAFALSRPAGVLVAEVTVGSASGNL